MADKSCCPCGETMTNKKAEQIVERILRINREPEIHSNERERFRDMVEVIEEALMLPEIEEALVWVDEMLTARDEMNGKVHCAPIRLSPITEKVKAALQLIKEARDD